MKSSKFFRKTVHFLLLLALILGQSLPAFATDEEHRFEEAIRSVRSQDVSCFISHAWGPEDEFVDRLNKHLRDANIRTHGFVRKGMSFCDLDKIIVF